MTRRSKLTDGVAAKCYELLEDGLYRDTVSQLIGIHPATFKQWMANTREPYLSFQAGVREAEAKAEQTQLSKITSSPETIDAKWYLARKHPNKWAETKRVDVSGRLDMGLKLDVGSLRDEKAREHIQGLADFLFAGGDVDASDASPDSDE